MIKKRMRLRDHSLNAKLSKHNKKKLRKKRNISDGIIVY